MALRRRFHGPRNSLLYSGGVKSAHNHVLVINWSSLTNTKDFRSIFKYGNKKIMSSFIAIFSHKIADVLDQNTNCDSRQLAQTQISNIAVGIIASKKIGNAVVRNRAKRRIREAWRFLAKQQGFCHKKKRIDQTQGILEKAVQNYNGDTEDMIYQQKKYVDNRAILNSGTKLSQDLVSINLILIARHRTSTINFRSIIDEMRIITGIITKLEKNKA